MDAEHANQTRKDRAGPEGIRSGMRKPNSKQASEAVVSPSVSEVSSHSRSPVTRADTSEQRASEVNEQPETRARAKFNTQIVSNWWIREPDGPSSERSDEGKAALPSESKAKDDEAEVKGLRYSGADQATCLNGGGVCVTEEPIEDNHHSHCGSRPNEQANS